MSLLAPSFSGTQLTLIIVFAVTCAVLFIANAILLTVLLHKRKRKKLCTAALQRRREQLLEELYALRFRQPAPKPAEVVPEDTERDDEESEDAESGSPFRTEILAVRDMTPLMRERFGFVGEEYDEKRYYVRSSLAFEAKLRAANGEVKTRYASVADEIKRYAKANVKRSFRQERVYKGRKTLAVLLFRGKTLCIAFALDPKAYEETKYHGEDMSEIKRYANTPMLLRLTSSRRVEYAKYLLGETAKAFGLEAGELVRNKYDFKRKSRGELFESGLLKITVLSEVAEKDYEAFEDADDEVAAAAIGRKYILPVADMSPLMRERFGFVGEAYDAKRYYVRYNFGFDAKLRTASDEVKARYTAFVNETGWYKKVKIGDGFRAQRIYCGRKTLGMITFKGKTLCVAFALDPKEFEETKYRGIDLSEVKRFEKTPMLLKLTSERKVGYAKYLFNRLAEEFTIEMREEQELREIDSKALSLSELYAAGALKITVLEEVPEGQE